MHSHIKGLGVDSSKDKQDGLVFLNHGIIGQNNTRKAAFLLLKMVNEGLVSGRAAVIFGPKGSGKSAIAKGSLLSFLAMSLSLGNNIPFVSVSASEFISNSRSKAESIIQYIRQAVNVEMIERVDIIEGEVVEFVLDARPEPVISFFLFSLLLEN